METRISPSRQDGRLVGIHVLQFVTSLPLGQEDIHDSSRKANTLPRARLKRYQNITQNTT